MTRTLREAINLSFSSPQTAMSLVYAHEAIEGLLELIKKQQEELSSFCQTNYRRRFEYYSCDCHEEIDGIVRNANKTLGEETEILKDILF